MRQRMATCCAIRFKIAGKDCLTAWIVIRPLIAGWTSALSPASFAIWVRTSRAGACETTKEKVLGAGSTKLGKDGLISGVDKTVGDGWTGGER